MTDLIFSFDTEDYVNPAGADGIIRASKLIREAGFTPCQNVVGWLAHALVKWGRQDVIGEIKKCEICTHSLRHSHHPTIAEYTDIEDFDEAMGLFRKDEDEAVRIIKEVFGVNGVVSACPPGSSFSSVAYYGYSDMGIKVYDDGCVNDELKSRPVSFCNMLDLKYNYGLDSFINDSKEDICELIEKMAQLEVCVIYHHPAKNTIVHFADDQNFNGENLEEENWILSELLPEEKIKRFEENLVFFLDKIKNDKRFNVTTYSEILKKYESERVIKRSHLEEIKKHIDMELFPVTTPDSLSLSDIMLACRDFLHGKTEHVCEKVYGFLNTPFCISQPVKVTASEMRESTKHIHDNEFLPTEIMVGDKKLGPADWLRAALIVLTGQEEAEVVPDKWQIDLNQFPRLRDLKLKGTWIHSPDFQDRFVTDRLRLQSWTIRLPKGTKRKIF